MPERKIYNAFEKDREKGNQSEGARDKNEREEILNREKEGAKQKEERDRKRN